jgi:hypothetical protein
MAPARASVDPVYGYIPWAYWFFVGYDEQMGPMANHHAMANRAV